MKVVLLSCLALLALAGTGSARPAAAAGANGIFVVRPDPRACPSPMCGGYWVALANHARTTCADGLLRPRCYVAEAIDAGTRQPQMLPSAGLAQATLGSQSFGNLGDLGTLVVADAWAPVSRDPPRGDFFRVRCTVHGRNITCPPGPTRLNSNAGTVRVTAATLPPHLSRSTWLRARRALFSHQGLLTAARISKDANVGRVFEVTQIYLKS